MKVSILGTNGFLSNAIAAYCNRKGWHLYMYGRTLPQLKIKYDSALIDNRIVGISIATRPDCLALMQ